MLFSVFLLHPTGPVIRPRRMMREIYGEITDTNAQNVTNFIGKCSTESVDCFSFSFFIVVELLLNHSKWKFQADTCLYDGSPVSRTSITCEKKHGCRAIQKTGECCPDYQCGKLPNQISTVVCICYMRTFSQSVECQRDGKVYANGEKVFDPETPCRVCYCQGKNWSRDLGNFLTNRMDN